MVLLPACKVKALVDVVVGCQRGWLCRGGKVKLQGFRPGEAGQVRGGNAERFEAETGIGGRWDPVPVGAKWPKIPFPFLLLPHPFDPHPLHPRPSPIPDLSSVPLIMVSGFFEALIRFPLPDISPSGSILKRKTPRDFPRGCVFRVCGGLLAILRGRCHRLGSSPPIAGSPKFSGGFPAGGPAVICALPQRCGIN